MFSKLFSNHLTFDQQQCSFFPTCSLFSLFYSRISYCREVPTSLSVCGVLPPGPSDTKIHRCSSLLHKTASYSWPLYPRMRKKGQLQFQGFCTYSQNSPTSTLCLHVQFSSLSFSSHSILICWILKTKIILHHLKNTLTMKFLSGALVYILSHHSHEYTRGGFVHFTVNLPSVVPIQRYQPTVSENRPFLFPLPSQRDCYSYKVYQYKLYF